MLRARSGAVQFTVVNKETGRKDFVVLEEYLTKKQRQKVAAFPDFIWQFSQHLKKTYLEKGEDVAVYVNSRVRINGRPAVSFIDPQVDLASEPWDQFRHHEWINPSPDFDTKKGAKN
jgi:hypothetical protein